MAKVTRTITMPYFEQKTTYENGKLTNVKTKVGAAPTDVVGQATHAIAQEVAKAVDQRENFALENIKKEVLAEKLRQGGKFSPAAVPNDLKERVFSLYQKTNPKANNTSADLAFGAWGWISHITHIELHHSIYPHSNPYGYGSQIAANISTPQINSKL